MEISGKWLRRPRKRRRRAIYKTRAQIARAMAQRKANGDAAGKGLPLPFPNIWDAWDPTKLPRDATDEEITARYLEFRRLCPLPVKRRHIL